MNFKIQEESYILYLILSGFASGFINMLAGDGMELISVYIG